MMTIREVCDFYLKSDEKKMYEVQEALDIETEVRTRILLHVSFLQAHKVAEFPFSRLFDVMADALKTAVGKGASAAVYPVDVAADGTMTLPPKETVIKAVQTLDLSNFGDRRLGVMVACEHAEPLSFRVVVGPFFELHKMMNASAKMMEGGSRFGVADESGGGKTA